MAHVLHLRPSDRHSSPTPARPWPGTRRSTTSRWTPKKTFRWARCSGRRPRPCWKRFGNTRKRCEVSQPAGGECHAILMPPVKPGVPKAFDLITDPRWSTSRRDAGRKRWPRCEQEVEYTCFGLQGSGSIALSNYRSQAILPAVRSCTSKCYSASNPALIRTLRKNHVYWFEHTCPGRLRCAAGS
jgi:hypothetical protein